MGLVPKFRNGKRCRRKLEKQNIQLKPEMTDNLCFSPWRILRLPRYPLTFSFPWTRPSIYSPWYHCQIDKVLKVWLDVLLTFLSARASCECNWMIIWRIKIIVISGEQANLSFFCIHIKKWPIAVCQIRLHKSKGLLLFFALKELFRDSAKMDFKSSPIVGVSN